LLKESLHGSDGLALKRENAATTANKNTFIIIPPQNIGSITYRPV